MLPLIRPSGTFSRRKRREKALVTTHSRNEQSGRFPPHRLRPPLLVGEGARRVPQSKSIARDEGTTAPMPHSHQVDRTSQFCYLSAMSNLESIKQDIRSLSADELSKLSDWLEVNSSVLLDSEIDPDARMGKLVKVTEQVLTDHRAGLTRPL
jgi:hypothetical protein